jgi:hypothetical protein
MAKEVVKAKTQAEGPDTVTEYTMDTLFSQLLLPSLVSLLILLSAHSNCCNAVTSMVSPLLYLLM